jgi:hypothetical protein
MKSPAIPSEDHQPHATGTGHHAAQPSALIPPAVVRLPIYFFVISAVSLASVGVAAIAVMPDAVRLFYQPKVLALVHTLTLGVITAAIMGVMYRYAPALAHRPIPYPRLARAQLVLFLLGTIGMIGHFAVGNWIGLWWSATGVLLSVVLFAVCLLPVLRGGVGKGVAETGMFFSICFLLCAGALGLSMGIEEAYGFVWANLPRMLGAHIIFAALGWVTLTICAASYRFIPAFLLPSVKLPNAAMWQIDALALTVAGLALSLLFALAGVAFWAAAVAASLLMYLVILFRLVRTRRMKIDWGLRHAQAGGVWLVATIILGVVVAWLGAWTHQGARWAAAFGAAGLLGWVVNFIMGMSYQLFPGFVTRVRAGLGWRSVTTLEISVPRSHPLTFVLYNAGVVIVVIAFASKTPQLAALGSILIAGAALLYAAVSLWTLSFAYRRSLPTSAINPLRVINS